MADAAPEGDVETQAEGMEQAGDDVEQEQQEEQDQPDQETEEEEEVEPEREDQDDAENDEFKDKDHDAQRGPQMEPCAFESEIYDQQKRPESVLSKFENPRLKNRLEKLLTDTTNNVKCPRGIQSLYNSSSSDCTLYSMFAFNDTFDYLFDRNLPNDKHSPMNIMMHQILIPLRKIGFVGAKRVVALKLALQRVGRLTTHAVVDVRKPGRFLDDLLKAGLRVPTLLSVVPTEVSQGDLDKNTKRVNSLPIKVAYKESQDFITSQQLIEMWSIGTAAASEKSDKEKTAKPQKLRECPQNLIMDLNREAGPYQEPLVVLPLIEIVLDDCLHGVKRICAGCQDSRVINATVECPDCLGKDPDHMHLSKCIYCDKCNVRPEKHAGGADKENPPHENQIQVPPYYRTDIQPSKGMGMSTSEDGRITFRYELFAVVCENVTGYVAYATTGVDINLLKDTIDKYLAPIERFGLEDGDKNAQAAPGTSEGGDDTTKPKVPEDAVPKQPAPTVTPTANADERPAELAPGETPPHLWVYFDPEAIVCEDERGSYNVPQVYAVQDFQSLIDYGTLDKAFCTVDPLEEDRNKQHQFRILCESVALFYRPKRDNNA